MVETRRTETVGEDGVLRIEMAGLEPGRKVEVMVRDGDADRGGWPTPVRRKPDAQGRYRVAGEFEGKIRIADDFDDPLPEMEPYS